MNMNDKENARYWTAERRFECLKLAVQNSTPGESKEAVLEKAAAFCAFMVNSEELDTLRQSMREMSDKMYKLTNQYILSREENPVPKPE
jgi:hypothetical protein